MKAGKKYKLFPYISSFDPLFDSEVECIEDKGNNQYMIKKDEKFYMIKVKNKSKYSHIYWEEQSYGYIVKEI